MLKRKRIIKIFINLITLLFIGLVIKDVYAIDKCAGIEKKFNNQIDIIFENINYLENCIKPASKYRLKSCVKRKQEGSKGFNCLPELSKALNANKKKDCEARFQDIKRSLKKLASLDANITNCKNFENK